MPANKAQKGQLKALGERVKSLRNERGLTLKDLAFAIGKEPQSIHRLEVGGINPTYLYLLDVCIGLDIDITELLDNLAE